MLVGRRAEGEAAIQDVLQQVVPNNVSENQVSYHCVSDIWNTDQDSALTKLFQSGHKISGVIHTAGPYAEESPTVLEAVIAAKIPVYVDVSDPLDFLDASLQQSQAAVEAGTTALCAAGAFPGMSNVLAMEAAAAAATATAESSQQQVQIQDVRFHYFTKGLGGSGTINLYITNIGFGDLMTQYDNGERRAFTELSGQLLGTVDFFFPHLLNSKDANKKLKQNNQQAHDRVGAQQVFAWPFPEAATVPLEIGDIAGSSSAAMGTAPDLWNVMLGILVQIVPRPLWRSKRFSKFMADFSQPLVLATDWFLQQTSPDKVGETHAMRIDVTTTTTSGGGSKSEATQMTSIVQAHESFRQCVGQSCAEFALDVWGHPSPSGGVFLPEQRYKNAQDRTRIIDKLTTTPGTFCYTGPVQVVADDSSYSSLPVYPTNIDQVVALAKQKEEQN